MHISRIAFISLLPVSWALSSDPKCTKGIQALLQPLSSFDPAQVFCTSKYPIKTTTVTAAATTTTLTSSAATEITSTTTLIAPTSTIFTTSTTTTTITTTTTQSAQKRAVTAEARGVDRIKASQLSSLAKAAGAVLSTFCSCIEAHPQATKTPTVTVTTTTTPYGIATEFLTPLTTSTVQTTVTSTTTVVKPAATITYCSFTAGGFGRPGAGGCAPGCYCDQHTGGDGRGVCDNSVVCGANCSSDSDCSSDEVCIGGVNCANGNTCASFVACGTTSANKRSVSGAHFKAGRREVLKRGKVEVQPGLDVHWHPLVG